MQLLAAAAQERAACFAPAHNTRGYAHEDPADYVHAVPGGQPAPAGPRPADLQRQLPSVAPFPPVHRGGASVRSSTTGPTYGQDSVAEGSQASWHTAPDRTIPPVVLVDSRSHDTDGASSA